MVVMRANVHRSQHSDPFNRLGKRNTSNTTRRSYNCGGYALETFSWYEPTGKAHPSWQDFCFKNTEEAERKTKKCVRAMLREFPTLRVIKTLADVRPDEYAIMFRLSDDGDFHFLKRDKRGHWRHKCGGWEVETIKVANIFGEWRFGRYNGPIVIMAKRREI